MIPLARPTLGQKEIDAIAETVRSGWVTQGPQVEAFERDFAALVGADYACATSSCTAALQLSLAALDIGPGDEVVTVSHSFIATANVIVAAGATPVFVDIDPSTFNIDVAQVQRALTKRTRAVIAVHQLGMPAELFALVELCNAHELVLIEDAACAIGSEISWQQTWQRIGAPIGAVACFSFHPRKLITTGDGGMITTRDGELDRRVRRLRQHGMDRSAAARHAAGQVSVARYLEPGFNFRMTDIQAAMGRVQLTRLDALVTRRREQAARYHELLAAVDGLEAPREPSWARSNWQSYAVRLRSRSRSRGKALASERQRAIMQTLRDQGIASGCGVMCAHREPAYQNVDWRSPLRSAKERTSTRRGDPAAALPRADR
jgi:perosamine synthetase